MLMPTGLLAKMPRKTVWKFISLAQGVKFSRVTRENRASNRGGVHLTGSPGARPSGRFPVRTEVVETIDLRAGGVEAA